MIGLILLITAISIIWYVSNEERNLLLKGAKQHTWSIGQTAAAFIVDPLLTKDYPAIHDYITHLQASFPLIKSIYVIRNDGKLVAYSGINPPSTIIPSSETEDSNSFTPNSNQYYITIDIKLDESSPLSLGKLTIQSSLREIHLAIQKQVIEITLILSIVFITLLGLMALIVRKWIVEPLDTLANFTQKISSGEMDHQIDHFRKDEFGSLMDDFNQMAEKLAESYAVLEQKVDERTKKLKEAQTELVKSEKLATLGQLTSVVSHELRNPMGTIQTSLYSIRQRLKGKELGVERALDRAERNVARCDDIIDELLDFTRIRKLNLESTNIDQWILDFLNEQVMPNEILLSKKLTSELTISIDRERLRRCMINVFSNATESITTKETLSKQEQLIVESYLENDKLIIKFTDTGTGITEEELKKIYDPLFSTKPFGVGLGLPITKQIIEQHKGGILIDSHLEKGTITILWLPAI